MNHFRCITRCITASCFKTSSTLRPFKETWNPRGRPHCCSITNPSPPASSVLLVGTLNRDLFHPIVLYNWTRFSRPRSFSTCRPAQGLVYTPGSAVLPAMLNNLLFRVRTPVNKNGTVITVKSDRAKWPEQRLAYVLELLLALLTHCCRHQWSYRGQSQSGTRKHRGMNSRQREGDVRFDDFSDREN